MNPSPETQELSTILPVKSPEELALLEAAESKERKFSDYHRLRPLEAGEYRENGSIISPKARNPKRFAAKQKRLLKKKGTLPK